MTLVVTAWNAVVIDEWNHDNEMKEMFLHAVSSIPSEYQGLPELLFERKRIKYPGEQWMVGNYEVKEKNGALVFRAEARSKNLN